MSRVTGFLESRLLTYTIVFLMLLVMGVLLTKNAREDSATADESIHILSGYESWHGVFTVNPEHPPLGKQIDAIPLQYIKPVLPEDRTFTNAINDFYYDAWAETKSYAWNWLYNTAGNNPDRIVTAARMVVVFVTLIFGWVLFLVSQKWYGGAAGLMAVFLFVFSPMLLTHGHLANTDLWIAFGFFGSIFSFAWYLEKPDLSRMIMAAIVFAMTLLLKFSAVLLLPVLTLVWLGKYCTSGKGKAYRWKPFFGTTLVFLIVSLFFIWADYGFPQNVAPHINLNTDKAHLEQSLRLMAPLLEHLPFPVYLKGLIMTVSSSFSDRRAYVLGHFYDGGVWYYFPLAFLVKEPLALLILLSAGIMSWCLWKKKLEFRDWLLMIPVGFYLLVSLLSRLNIGIRHLLPIYPFVFIFISYFVSEFFARLKKSSKNALLSSCLILSFLLAWYLYANISVYPYYMTYFNELVGGPRGGVRVLADSNIDWGQDTKRLASWIKEQNIQEPIRMEYFWSDEVQPRYYGINFVPLKKNDPSQEGWIAIGVTALQRPEFSWLKRYQPVKIIGNSVYVYRRERRNNPMRIEWQ